MSNLDQFLAGHPVNAVRSLEAVLHELPAVPRATVQQAFAKEQRAVESRADRSPLVLWAQEQQNPQGPSDSPVGLALAL
jgi:hypothetical protein